MKNRPTILLLICLVAFSISACSANEKTAPIHVTSEPSDISNTSSYSEGGEITLAFSFGTRTGIYSGELNSDGLPNGHGVFSSKNSGGNAWTYEGDWVNGHWNGKGKTTWGDGATYVGSYLNDVASGYGVYTLPTGEQYEGIFDNINVRGEFTLHYTDGSRLEGTFDDFDNATGTYYSGGFEYEALLSDGELTLYPYFDFFSDEQRQAEYKALYQSYRYSELIEYVNAYISSEAPTPYDTAYKILDLVQPAVQYEDQWDVQYDEFDGKYLLTFNSMGDISHTNSVAVSVKGTGLDIKIGFMKSGWLFFDSISLSIDGDVVYNAAVNSSSITRNVISGSTIEEYCYCSFYDDVLNKLRDADTVILRFSNDESGEIFDHTLTQSEIDALHCGLLLRINNKELSNLLYRFNKRNEG